MKRVHDNKSSGYIVENTFISCSIQYIGNYSESLINPWKNRRQSKLSTMTLQQSCKHDGERQQPSRP